MIDVESKAAAVANEIESQIKTALTQSGDGHRWSAEVLDASRGLDAEAATLGDAAQVAVRVEHLRAQLAMLTDPAALAQQRQVMARAAARLRAAVGGAHAGLHPCG